MTAGSEPKEALFTFRSGGWVVALACAISVLMALFWVVPVLRHPRPRPIGDGRDVATYGFDLKTTLVPRTELIAAGLPKDGLPSLDAPHTMAGNAVETYNKAERDAHRSKYLVPSDAVVGIELAGEARAFPLRILQWHEVVNDRVGGREIGIAYSPLAGSVVAFDREVAGETLRFGVSGLLYNSTGLLFDRRAGAKDESLWLPLQARAIAGPAAAKQRTLTLIPVQVTRWATWLAMHPSTTVLLPDPLFVKRYKDDAYSSYYGSDALRFPVKPLPPESSGLALKTPCVVLGAGAELKVVPLTTEGVVRTTVGGRPVRLLVEGAPPTAYVESEDGGPPPIVAHASWFAWYSTHNP